MTHLGYIAAAYGATAIILVGVITVVILDLARQKRRLRQLESEGRGRRSGAPP